MKQLFPKLVLFTVYILIISVVFFLFFELAYRYQWFDTYKAEFKSQNDLIRIDSSKKTILVCGDSFTAHPLSYISVLKDSLSDFTILNAAVPGSCIRQHALYLPKLFKKFNPDIFIYQFYVGNDLFDISHPYDSKNISFIRKLYWFLSDHLLGLSFLNFRLAGFRYQYFDDAGGRYNAKGIDEFSTSNYSSREKFNYIAEPFLVENTMYLQAGRQNDWLLFKSQFSTLIHQLNDSIPKYFILVPHESQLSPSLKDKHVSLGSKFSKITTDTYPLQEEIKQLCQSLRVTLVDFSKPPVDSILYDKLYYPNDPHLSILGQQLLGKTLVKVINQ